MPGRAAGRERLDPAHELRAKAPRGEQPGGEEDKARGERQCQHTAQVGPHRRRRRGECDGEAARGRAAQRRDRQHAVRGRHVAQQPLVGLREHIHHLRQGRPADELVLRAAACGDREVAVQDGGDPTVGQLLLAQHLAQAFRPESDGQHLRHPHHLHAPRHRHDGPARGTDEDAADDRPALSESSRHELRVGLADACQHALVARQGGVHAGGTIDVEQDGDEAAPHDPARRLIERQQVAVGEGGRGRDRIEQRGGQPQLPVHPEREGTRGLNELVLEAGALARHARPGAGAGQRDEGQGESEGKPRQQPPHRRAGAGRGRGRSGPGGGGRGGGGGHRRVHALLAAAAGQRGEASWRFRSPRYRGIFR